MAEKQPEKKPASQAKKIYDQDADAGNKKTQPEEIEYIEVDPAECKVCDLPGEAADSAATGTPEQPPAKPGETAAKLAATEEKLAETKDKLLRTAAEYDNFRKRTAAEYDRAFGNGKALVLEKVLPVIDTLEAAAAAETADAEYKKGVELTLTNLQGALQSLGVEAFGAPQEAFDPNLHNAVMQLPAEGAESGTITQVLQKGYRLDERILRPAMVAVAP